MNCITAKTVILLQKALISLLTIVSDVIYNNILRRPILQQLVADTVSHDGVIIWKHFPRYWPFVRGIHRSRRISRTKTSNTELWCFALICVWINGWVNNREAGDMRHYHAHYDVTVMSHKCALFFFVSSRISPVISGFWCLIYPYASELIHSYYMSSGEVILK